MSKIRLVGYVEDVYAEPFKEYCSTSVPRGSVSGMLEHLIKKFLEEEKIGDRNTES